MDTNPLEDFDDDNYAQGRNGNNFLRANPSKYQASYHSIYDSGMNS